MVYSPTNQQGMPPQGMPPQGMPPQGMPPQGGPTPSFGSVNEIVEAFRNRVPELEERYNVSRQLIDLLALQKIKSEQQSIANQLEMDLQQQAMANGQGINVAQQTAQQAQELTTNNMLSAAQNAGIGAILNERNADSQVAGATGGRLYRGGLDHIPSNVQPYSGGGIIAFASGSGNDPVNTWTSPSRGETNNPFNLRDYDQEWEGQIGITDDGFVIFEDLASGIRAADKTLQNYKGLYGVRTIRELVNKFAPPNENPTEEYIEFVAERVGRSPDEPIDLDNDSVRDNLLGAMGRMENQFDYDPTQLVSTDRERTSERTSEEIVASDVGDQSSDDPAILHMPDMPDQQSIAGGQSSVLTDVARGAGNLIYDTAQATYDDADWEALDPAAQAIASGINTLGSHVDDFADYLQDHSMESLDESGEVLSAEGNVSPPIDVPPVSHDPFDPNNQRYIDTANIGKELDPGITASGDSWENWLAHVMGFTPENVPVFGLSEVDKGVNPAINDLIVQNLTGQTPEELQQGGAENELAANQLPPPSVTSTTRGLDWDRLIAGLTGASGQTTSPQALSGFSRGILADKDRDLATQQAYAKLDYDLQAALVAAQSRLGVAKYNNLVDQMMEWRMSPEYQRAMREIDSLPPGLAKQAAIAQLEQAQAERFTRVMTQAVGGSSGSTVTATAPAQIVDSLE